MHRETTTYDQLQAALDLADLDMRASEVHGMVCGEICRQLRLGRDPDYPALLGVSADTEGAEGNVLRIAIDLADQSRRALDAGMEFDLLIPGEHEPIDERTGSLADWARGFALALLRGDELRLADLDDNSAEVVRDLMKISEAQPGEETEEDERALAEIEEYMRVGVQLVFEELHPEEQSPAADRSVH